MADTRPSGARVYVLKTFPSEADCLSQFNLLMAAPDDAVVRPLQFVEDRGFAMPLLRQHIPDYAISDVRRCLMRLWKAPDPRPATSRAAYHAYVLSREPVGPSCHPEYQDLLRATKAEIELAYLHVCNIPVRQKVFVHGDAILSNFVYRPPSDVMAIDLSVRGAPSEREVDASKLLMSACGFDVAEIHRRRLIGNQVSRLVETYALDTTLMDYYLLSHLVRVATKEPPNDRERMSCYERVLRYVIEK